MVVHTIDPLSFAELVVKLNISKLEFTAFLLNPGLNVKLKLSTCGVEINLVDFSEVTHLLVSRQNLNTHNFCSDVNGQKRLAANKK